MFASFNAQATRLAVGTGTGFNVYALRHPESDEAEAAARGRSGAGFRLLCSRPVPGGVSAVALLDETPLAAVVGGGSAEAVSSREVTVVALDRDAPIARLTFPAAVASVQLNARTMLVVAGAEATILDVPSLRVLRTVPFAATAAAVASVIASLLPPIAQTQRALPVLSPEATNSFIFVPVDRGCPGQLELMRRDNVLRQVAGDNTPVCAMQFSPGGSLLAVATNGGCTIRVLHCPAGNTVYTFKRGRQSAWIDSMFFATTDEGAGAAGLLAVASNRGTLHAFRFQGSATADPTSSVRVALEAPKTPESYAAKARAQQNTSFNARPAAMGRDQTGDDAPLAVCGVVCPRDDAPESRMVLLHVCLADGDAAALSGVKVVGHVVPPQGHAEGLPSAPWWSAPVGRALLDHFPPARD